MRKDLNGILAFTALIWIVFLADKVIPYELTAWGLLPRTTQGLIGIVSMPFLHGTMAHLCSNTIPLVVLLLVMFGSRVDPIRIVIALTLLSGTALWVFGRERIHIGASGLIYAMTAFLIVTGLIERKPVPLAISALVGFLYGGTLLWGVLPFADDGVSWDGHLAGAACGCLLAWGLARRRKKSVSAISSK